MSAATPKHHAFSFGRIAAIASNTLLELVRQKVFYFMLVFAMLGIGSSFFASGWKFAEQFQVLKDVSLGAMSVFSWLLATLATAMVLPKDLEDRTLYTILAKPVSRLEYLIGKFLGVVFLLFLAISLMTVVFYVVLFAREQAAIAETTGDFGGNITPELQAALTEIRQNAFSPGLFTAVLVIFTKAAVVASLTLTISTFATSWIFTVMTSIAVYIIGQVQPIAREYWLEEVPAAQVSVLTKAFLGIASVIFPDFRLFNVVDEIVVGNAVPNWMLTQTFGLGFGYVFIFMLVGYVCFAHREL
jgi:ABC-type Na+ efflux pump permease subunit